MPTRVARDVSGGQRGDDVSGGGSGTTGNTGILVERAARCGRLSLALSIVLGLFIQRHTLRVYYVRVFVKFPSKASTQHAHAFQHVSPSVQSGHPCMHAHNFKYAFMLCTENPVPTHIRLDLLCGRCAENFSTHYAVSPCGVVPDTSSASGAL